MENWKGFVENILLFSESTQLSISGSAQLFGAQVKKYQSYIT
jgi:hypothetical protein